MPRPPITRQAKAGVGGRPPSAIVPFAATITPDASQAGALVIGTLTGAVTIAAPIKAVLGDRIILVLTQDATGGRIVTWNAVYKNAPTINGSAAANQINCPEFVYNGTNWIYIA